MKSVKLFSMLCVFGLVGCSDQVNFSSSPVHQKNILCQGGEIACDTTPVTEKYTVPNASGKADILFVMDGSPTTALTVTRMADRIRGFEATLNGLDWQIGITNSGMSNLDASYFNIGELLPLTPNLNLPDKTPFNVVTPGLSEDLLLGNLNFHGVTWGNNEGSYCEQEPYCTTLTQPLRELKTFIANAKNKTFFRPGSFLVPIIITALDEASGAPAVNSADVISAFQQNLGSTMAGLRAYSVIIRPGDAACLNEYSSIFRMGSGGQYGTQLDQFAKATGGKSISICQSNFTQALSEIPKSLGPSVTTITLKQTPIQSTVQITSVPAASLDYTVDGNVITFSQALLAGSQLTINYLVESVPN